MAKPRKRLPSQVSAENTYEKSGKRDGRPLSSRFTDAELKLIGDRATAEGFTTPGAWMKALVLKTIGSNGSEPKRRKR